MPQIFRLGSYRVFFWLDEGMPVEPVHVHVSKGVPAEKATKLWITKAGGCVVAHNNSRIPQHELNNLMQMISGRCSYILEEWKKYFGEPRFYC